MCNHRASNQLWFVLEVRWPLRPNSHCQLMFLFQFLLVIKPQSKSCTTYVHSILQTIFGPMSLDQSTGNWMRISQMRIQAISDFQSAPSIFCPILFLPFPHLIDSVVVRRIEVLRTKLQASSSGVNFVLCGSKSQFYPVLVVRVRTNWGFRNSPAVCCSRCNITIEEKTTEANLAESSRNRKA